MIYNVNKKDQENNEDILESTLKNELLTQKYPKSERIFKQGGKMILAKKLSIADDDVRHYVRLPISCSSVRNKKPFL